MNSVTEEHDPIPYIEKILKEGTEAIESFRNTKDVTKIIWFTQRCIPRMEALEELAKNTDFIECLKKCEKWIARHDINGHKHVVVEIDKIEWDRKVINWHNITEEYPKGGSTFTSFKEDFFPWRK